MPRLQLPSRSTLGRRLLAMGSFVALGAVAISVGCGNPESDVASQVLAPAESEMVAESDVEDLSARVAADSRVADEVQAESPPDGADLDFVNSSFRPFLRPPLDVDQFASLDDPHERGVLIHVLDENGLGVESIVWLLEANVGLTDRELLRLREGSSPYTLQSLGGIGLGPTDSNGWIRVDLPQGAFWLGATADTTAARGMHVNWVVPPSQTIVRVTHEQAVAGPVEVLLEPSRSRLVVEVIREDGEPLDLEAAAFRGLRLVLRQHQGAGYRYVNAGSWSSFRSGSNPDSRQFGFFDLWPVMAQKPLGWEVAIEGGESVNSRPVPIGLDDLWTHPDDSERPGIQVVVPAFGALELAVRDEHGRALAIPHEVVLRQIKFPGKPRPAEEWRRNWRPLAKLFDPGQFFDPDTGELDSRVAFAPLPLGAQFEARLRFDGASHWHHVVIDGPRIPEEATRYTWTLDSSGAVCLKGQLDVESGELPERGTPRFLLVRDGLPLAGDLRRPPLDEARGFQLEFDESEVGGATDLALRITWLDHWAQVPLPELVPGKPLDLGRIVLGEAPLLVAGRVVGTDGRGLGGVRVSIAARNGERTDGEPRYDDLSDVAFTDADGAFEFRGRVAAEALGLRAESARFARQDFVEVLTGTGNASLRLWPGGQVSGRVSAGGELPTERLELELQGPDGSASTERQRPRADGSFQFDSLEFDRDYAVALNYRGLARGAQPWPLVAPMAVRSLEPPSYGADPLAAPGLDALQLDQALRTIELEALESGGDPAEHFQVRVTDSETGQLLEQLQGADGRWALALPNIPVDLEVWSDDSARVLIPAARDSERVVLSDPLTVTLELVRAEDLRFDGEPVPEYRMAVGLRRLIDDRPVQLPSLKSLVGPKGRARFQGLTFGSFDVQLQVSDPASGRSGWVDVPLDAPPRLDLTPDSADQVQRISVPREALLDAVVAALDLDAEAESGE